MVVLSLPGNDELKGRVFGGVPDVMADIPKNPVLPRRMSARVKKIQAEKALQKSLEEDKPETKVVQKRIPRPPTNRRRKTLPVDANEAGFEGNPSDSDVMADESDAKSTEEYTSGVVKALLSLQNQTYKCFSEKVKVALRAFNKLYLHFTQVEEKRVGPIKPKRSQASKNKEKAPKDDQNEDTEEGPEVSKKRKRGDGEKIRQRRPDIKAMSKIIQTNAVLHPKKIVGAFPGIEPGYQFFSRAEMVVVGFHQHQISGIDYIGKTPKKGSYEIPGFAGYKLPLATSIIVSGQYEDDKDNSEDLVYTGQGGNDFLGRKNQIGTQVMARGNLALKNSIQAGTPVRVVRGHKIVGYAGVYKKKDKGDSYAGKVYTYDGLYKVTSYGPEEGKSGHLVYKFNLKRLAGQPPLTTDKVYFTGSQNSPSKKKVTRVVSTDISGGLEKIPIPATNDVDDAELPAGFTYRTSMKVAKNIKLPANASGCDCKEVCNPKKCSCARLNGSDFPYVHVNGGRLIEAKAVVFECGPHCGCKPECVNRTSQKGLRYRLEVFRTENKGWGVRSRDYIPMGAPICEYLGVVKKTDDVKFGCDDTYIFDIDCLQTMKGLDGRESRLKDVALPCSSPVKNDDDNSDPLYCIDGFKTGNVSRFINHSCSPNLFVQCVLSSHHDVNFARVVLFAADIIRPYKELSYDYGYAIGSVLNREMYCHCGEPNCRKRLF